MSRMEVVIASSVVRLSLECRRCSSSEQGTLDDIVDPLDMKQTSLPGALELRSLPIHAAGSLVLDMLLSNNVALPLTLLSASCQRVILSGVSNGSIVVFRKTPAFVRHYTQPGSQGYHRDRSRCRNPRCQKCGMTLSQ